MPKFPGVPAIVTDGNAFAVIAAVRKAMKRNGATQEDIKQYMSEATSGDYDHLILVSSEYVDIDTPDMHESREEDEEWVDDPYNPWNENPSDLDELDELNELDEINDMADGFIRAWDEDDEDFRDEEFDDFSE